MLCGSGSDFWGHELPIGLTFCALDHVVNATFIAYLLVFLFGMRLPATRHRPSEIMATVFVLLALAGMHVVINFVSRF